MTSKLYLATQQLTAEAVFASSQTSKSLLESEAPGYLNEAGDYAVQEEVSIKNIAKVSHLPKVWKEPGVYIWGVDMPMTAKEWFQAPNKDAIDPDFKDYIRLKKKFEG